MKKIIFLAATHGNENFTIPILKKLSKKSYSSKFDWLIANPRALKKKRRFIDADLNRVAPGNNKSSKYEVRKAYNLIGKLKQYDYTIDLHGTIANTGIFTIITNLKKENLILAATLPIKNIVVWDLKNSKKIGPLTKFVNCGVEIECGPKNSTKIQKQLYKILNKFLKNNIYNDKIKFKKKTFYKVYGVLTEKEYIGKNKKLKDFKKVKINNEVFFPLLVNRYMGIICYKMKKININL